ncbi:MAG: ATP synthase F1 subunit gamma [Candidatus Tritonobacter lacicola]|nr:ATP synthase F1 subunit gamma [Candidatus Tritonobacter lacicola]
MANTRDIRSRIKSIREIQHITRAMKMVAAAKLRKAQNRQALSMPAVEVLSSLLDELLYGAREEINPLMRKREGGPPGYIVITSDKGLCGGFNTGIIKRAMSLVGGGGLLVSIGKKGNSFFARCGLEFARKYEDVSMGEPKRIVNDIAGFIIAKFLSGEVGFWDVVFNRYDSVYEQGVVAERIVPVDIDRQSKERPPMYLIEPSYLSLLDAVIKQVLRQKIQTCLMKSDVAEQLARMNAMESASDNAADLIDELTLNYNRARQAAITGEIVEIVGGAEALASAY